MMVGFEAWLKRLRVSPGRVALLSHQAALISTGETSAEALRRILGKDLVALFGPEHGYVGSTAAGEKTYTFTHPVWGIPVHSLYGEHRKPSPESLRGIDLIIVDLQDLGVRCYTYMATLRLMLEACAEERIPCLVCDRPVPFHGRPEGPVAETDHLSFVAPCEVPFVHGMLPTEIAAWLGLPFLSAPIRGQWTDFLAIRSPEFIPPSPAIRSRVTAMLYPSTVLAEAFPALDVMRSTPWAFRVLSAPWIDGEATAAALNAAGLPGVTFYGFVSGPACGSIRLHLTDPAAFRPWQTAVTLFRTLHDLYPTELEAGMRPEWLGKLLGCAPLHALRMLW